MEKRKKIINANIPPLLLKLTIPSIVGVLGLMIFNLADTYFIGKLGVTELAAISFTFPVVMIINSVFLGISIASMSLFAKAAGRHNREEERMLATSSLFLGLILSVLISLIGFFTITPLFKLIGASNELMPYIVEYMSIWYLGVVFVIVPMIGDGILRGLGDTFTPSIVMLTVAVVNIILDPLLIFGSGLFPALGIKGAAIATVFARMMAGIVSVYIQVKREDLIIIKGIEIKKIIGEWKDLFYIGLPNAGVKAIMPFGMAVFTSILAKFGKETVAGFGVAIKIESIFMSVTHALGVTTAVFVGQNLGAKKYFRIKEGIKWIYTYAIVFGIISFVILWFTGFNISGFFSDDMTIQTIGALYLSIVPLSYGLFGIGQSGAAILNVYHKPLLAGSLNFMQVLVIGIPLGYILSSCMQAKGLFTAILMSNIFLGLFSVYMVRRVSNKILLKD